MTTATVRPDIIDQLAGIEPGGSLDLLRRRRTQARDNAQLSFEALLEPAEPGGFGYDERYAVAAFVAGLHRFGAAADFYADLLGDAAADLVAPVTEAVALGRAEGPAGQYREPELAGESTPGPQLELPAALQAALGARLTAALQYTHALVYRPRDSRPESLEPLAAAGWTADQVVSLAQLVSFLAFQLRIAHGLRAVGGQAPLATRPGAQVEAGAAFEAATGETESAGLDAEPAGAVEPGFEVLRYPELHRPVRFVQHSLGWEPWVPPLAEDELTDEQKEALVEPGRIASPYFRLLARDAAALKARTLTDKDIFYNTADGLGRAERELAAAATSRFNGCVFCASVHSGFATKESGREADVQRLLDAGVDTSGARADLGDAVWNAVAAAAVALTRTPAAFGEAEVAALRAAGLDDGAIIDVINGSAFFNWANRLMLTLGEPELPARFR